MVGKITAYNGSANGSASGIIGLIWTGIRIMSNNHFKT